MKSLFKISGTPSEELKVILRENVIGTPGKGMLYQHTTSDEKLALMSTPFFVNLVRAEKILGTCTFSVRETIDKGIQNLGAYLRYFHFNSQLRRSSSRAITKVGILRNEIDSLLEGHDFGLPHKHFSYAYYDPSNERSVMFCKQYRFEETRSFRTILFTRLSIKPPSARLDVHELSTSEVEKMKGLLSNYYMSYTMFSFENLFRIGKYYVVKDLRGDIVAGLQVNPDRWKLLSLKPPLGKMKLDVVSRIPFLNAIIAKDLSFLAVEGIYCRDGYEENVQHLLEYLLRLYKRHVALLFADNESSIKQLFDQMDLGFAGRFNNANEAKVICRFQGFSDQERRAFTTQPAYISSIDIT